MGKAYASTGPDQLQLLRRNAEQILQIVKATFPNAPFGERSHIKDCSTSASDIQELVCKWQQASQLQVERNKNSPELTRKMMQSLTEVCGIERLPGCAFLTD